MDQTPPKSAKTGMMPETALQVISSLYDTVTEGASYEPMFFAMDGIIDDLLADTNPDQSVSSWATTFLPHFDRAGHVFDIMSRHETQTPLNFVEQQRNPAAVISRSGKIIVTNRRWDVLETPTVDADLSALFATPADATRFSSLAMANDVAAQAIIGLNLPGENEVVSALAGHVDGDAASPEGGPLLYVMLIKPRWTEKTGQLLQEAFSLTHAEIETLESFIACGSVKGIAERRGRSIRTVRTQLSRVFSQMGITGQTELALFLATLSGMEPAAYKPIRGPQAEESRAERIVSQVVTLQGKRVEYIEYGATAGQPILLLQSTHPPELTLALRRALYHAGLRVIAPLKPGSGQSETIKGRPGPEAMAPTYAALMDLLGLKQAVVAGQASGGLYALEFARAFPDRVSSVCLVDTGVPFRDRADITALPKGIRRTMAPARYFPNILYLPHRLVAANFRRSARGEASVVDYFFSESPIDQQLTRTDRAAYDLTRRIISHSFDDSDRLVEDVSRWASDWSGLLAGVCGTHSIYFVHGTENTMFLHERIEDFVVTQPNAELVSLEGTAQLSIFEQPEKLVDTLAALAKWQ